LEPPRGFLGRRILILGLAQTLAAQQEDLGVFHQAVSDAVAVVVLKRIFPQSENGVLCADDGGALLAVAREITWQKMGGLLIKGARLRRDSERNSRPRSVLNARRSRRYAPYSLDVASEYERLLARRFLVFSARLLIVRRDGSMSPV
jgi:hypothetical protein